MIKKISFVLAMVLVLAFSVVATPAQALSPVGSWPAGCTSYAGYSSLTGVKCDNTSSQRYLPIGCTVDTNYSPITGEKCPVKPPVCYAYAHLTIGSRGVEVVELQSRLVADGYLKMPAGVAKGYFGNLTAQAMARVMANGLLCTSTGNQPPVISGVSGQTTLSVGQTGTWTVRASDPENGNLNYSVVWGDEASLYNTAHPGVAADSLAEQRYVQTTIFSHAYAQAGAYQPKFYVRDNAGRQVMTSISVNVGGQVASPSIKVTSPNGGEMWQDHATANISWTNIFPDCSNCGAPMPSFYTRPVDIYLEPHSIQCFTTPCTQPSPYVLDKNVTRVNNIYGWIVATDINDRQIPTGKYKVKVCVAGSATDCDLSDNYFDSTPRYQTY